MVFQVRRECGHCNRLADITFVFAMEVHREPDRVIDERNGFGHMRVQVLNERDKVEGSSIAICPMCGRPNLFAFTTLRSYLPNIVRSVDKPEPLFGGESIIKVTAAYPIVENPRDHPSWPEGLRKLFIDAQTMQRQQLSPTMVIVACRSVLEAAVKDLGGEGRDLRAQIDSLADGGVITKPLKDWAHRVRIEGNQAVHEIGGTSEEAAELVDFVRMFLDMTFTIPATIAKKTSKS